MSLWISICHTAVRVLALDNIYAESLTWKQRAYLASHPSNDIFLECQEWQERLCLPTLSQQPLALIQQTQCPAFHSPKSIWKVYSCLRRSRLASP